MKKILLLLSEKVIKYKILIILFWIVFLAISIINIAINKNSKVENELSGLENTEANQVIEILKKDFGVKLGNSFALVLEKDTKNIDLLKDKLKNRFDKIIKVSEITGNSIHKNKLLYIEINPKYPFMDVQNFTPELRNYIKIWSDENNTKTYLTGNPAFHYDGDKAGKSDSARGELVAIVLSFFILIFNFGALISALLPLLIGASTLIYLNSLIRFMGLETNALSQILTSFLGLALAIDYSLFIVSRYREEIAKGQSEKDAVANVFIYPIKTIIVSSLIMICSISALLLPDVSTSKNVVYNLFTVIAISMFNSIIILPSLLIYLKKWLDKPKFLSDAIKKADTYLFWKKFATNIVNNSKIYFSISVIILILLSLPVSKIRLWEAVHTLTPENTESMEGYKVLENDNWGGELVPINIIVKSKQQGDAYSQKFISYVYNMTKTISKNPEVGSVQSITSWNKDYNDKDYYAFYKSTYSLNIFSLNNNINPLINAQTGNNLTIINVYPKNLLDLNNTHELINFIRNYSKNNGEYEVLVGGIVARARDFTNELYRYIPEMLTIIFIGIYIILFFYMKSVVLPLKAGIMNFLPILSSFGILTLIFQYRFMHNIFKIQENSGVINMVPVILFCVIFGLSMDYEVLILSRITESYESKGNVREAVIEGIARSGSVITGAALILLAVFVPGVFSSAPPTKQISIGIISSILIDATIVRLLLVPSFMMLMGKWNWWNPLKKDYNK